MNINKYLCFKLDGTKYTLYIGMMVIRDLWKYYANYNNKFKMINVENIKYA